MDKRLCIATATPSRTNYILKSSCLNWCGLFLWVIIMTIQSVNLTVPGGDTPRSAFTKLNSNFSDTNNAASRLVGRSLGNVMQVGAFGLGDDGERLEYTSRSALQLANPKSGFYRCKTLNDGPLGVSYVDFYIRITSSANGSYLGLMAQAVNQSSTVPNLYFCHYSPSGWTDWAQVYSTKNTTLDSNGAIKPSSPVLRVYAEEMTVNADGDAMGATYTKNGVGDYTISGTTGLRTDGWYIVVPNDMNGNPKVAVTLDETDGIISLKCYKRIFSMTTFTFEPDLNEPLDIPDGRWIDLRFNDLPVYVEPAQQPNN